MCNLLWKGDSVLPDWKGEIYFWIYVQRCCGIYNWVCFLECWFKFCCSFSHWTHSLTQLRGFKKRLNLEFIYFTVRYSTENIFWNADFKFIVYFFIELILWSQGSSKWGHILNSYILQFDMSMSLFFGELISNWLFIFFVGSILWPPGAPKGGKIFNLSYIFYWVIYP